MGIVVTVFMILILLLSVPNPLKRTLGKAQYTLASFALLAGLWNVFWYALQFVGTFWGNAALVSGILMIITSLLLIKPLPLAAKLNAIMPMPLRVILLVSLASCASFYTYTLVLLNL